MKNYRLTVISLSEKPAAVKKIVTQLGGNIIDEKPSQSRPLAYPIRRQKTAYFTTYTLHLAREKVADFSRGLRSGLKLDEEVLRFLLTSQMTKRKEEILPEKIVEKPAEIIPAPEAPVATEPKVAPLPQKPATLPKPVPKVEEKPKSEVEEALQSEEERLKLLDEKLDEILKE